MRLAGRFIPREAILAAVTTYELVEAYPDDKYFPSYLTVARHGPDAFHVLFATDIIDLCISNRHHGHKKGGSLEPVMNERMRAGRLVTLLVMRQRVAMRSSMVSGWPLASLPLKWAQTNSSGLSSGA